MDGVGGPETGPIGGVPEENNSTQIEINETQKEEAENFALSKVVDLNDNYRYKGKYAIGFHEISHDLNKGRPLLAGLFYSEQILTQGILSRDLSEKTGIKRSRFGHNPDADASYTPKNSVALNPAYNFLQERDGSDGNYSLRDWSLVCKYERESRKVNEDPTRADEVDVVGRVKPSDIIGIAVSEKMLDINIYEFINSLPNEEVVSELKRVSEFLGLGIVENTDSEEKRNQLISSIFEKLGYGNIATVGDYLKALGLKFKMPIYTDDDNGVGLYWPKRINSLKMAGQFPIIDDLE
jgi:hypothetical protein